MLSSLLRASLVLVTMATLLTGCGQPNDKAPFDLKVELMYASPECDDDPECWLPTQFQPMLVSGESVSQELWPVKGDTVQILCQTKGELIQDYAGQASDKWFGIKVPANKIAQPSTEAEAVEDGYLAYVSAVWLAGTTNQAPDC